jgi:protein gp37
MSARSGIEWTGATWNPVTGCTKVSPGCDHCYAERITERFHGPGAFAQVTLHPERLGLPLRWRAPRRVFVNSMADLFHAAVPDEFIAAVFATMRAAPQHTFQILTKRPARMRAFVTRYLAGAHGAARPAAPTGSPLHRRAGKAFPDHKTLDGATWRQFPDTGRSTAA